MKILAIGDVVGAKSIEYLNARLWKYREANRVDFVVANGENASDIHGISAPDARSLLDAGADLITLGNHTYGRRDICTLLSDSERIIRPANYPPMAPGGGYTLLRIGGCRLLCINVLGTALMESLACPFQTVDRILEREAGNYDISLMDIHAEATSEKLAMGYMLDGRVSAVWGTHTHVPTADARVLPKGTGYVTDLGMTGPRDSVLGIRPELSIRRFRGDLPERYRWAEGASKIEAVLFTIDSETGKCRKAERVDKWD